MNSEHVRICLVDDDEDDFILTRDLLKEIDEQRFEISWIKDYAEAVEALTMKRYDVYLVDFLLGEFNGIDLLNEAEAMGAQVPVIILTGKGNADIDRDAMRSGAADYLIKDKLSADSLERSIRYSLQQSNALKALKESENKYRNIFEKTKDVIYMTNKHGQFLDINVSASELFGYSKQEFMQMNAAALYANPADRLEFERRIHEQGSVKDFEVELLNKKSERLYCLLSTVIQYSADDTEEIYLGIIHDLTKRKKAEQEMMNTEKFAATGRLARMIAHEVRNPLTNIHLALDQLQSNEPDEDSRMFLDIIDRNSSRINQLITELLNSSKPANLEFKEYNITTLLQETLALASDRITLKNIQLITQYGLDASIRVDKEKLQIAFLNMIINAIEAMPEENGVLRVETSISEEHNLQVRIFDNGSGIPQENLNHLFEPFFSSKPKGIGLGLTATHNIIINHKGSIEVESKQGHGTCFTIQFPLNN
jgi:PAS domain S-box-containing protein